jgi:hypothetical protein
MLIGLTAFHLSHFLKFFRCNLKKNVILLTQSTDFFAFFRRTMQKASFEAVSPPALEGNGIVL